MKLVRMEILWEEEGFQFGFKRWQGWAVSKVLWEWIPNASKAREGAKAMSLAFVLLDFQHAGVRADPDTAVHVIQTYQSCTPHVLIWTLPCIVYRTTSPEWGQIIIYNNICWSGHCRTCYTDLSLLIRTLPYMFYRPTSADPDAAVYVIQTYQSCTLHVLIWTLPNMLYRPTSPDPDTAVHVIQTYQFMFWSGHCRTCYTYLSCTLDVLIRTLPYMSYRTTSPDPDTVVHVIQTYQSCTLHVLIRTLPYILYRPTSPAPLMFWFGHCRTCYTDLLVLIRTLPYILYRPTSPDPDTAIHVTQTYQSCILRVVIYFCQVVR